MFVWRQSIKRHILTLGQHTWTMISNDKTENCKWVTYMGIILLARLYFNRTASEVLVLTKNSLWLTSQELRCDETMSRLTEGRGRDRRLCQYKPEPNESVQRMALSWWRHQMETFSALLAFCGEFTGHRWIPHTKASDAELWCFLGFFAWINVWENNREAGDLRRHCAHYAVTVMAKKWSDIGDPGVVMRYVRMYDLMSHMASMSTHVNLKT